MMFLFFFFATELQSHACSATPIHFKVTFFTSFANILFFLIFPLSVQFYCTGAVFLPKFMYSTYHHKVLWCDNTNNHDIAFVHFIDCDHRKSVQNATQEAEAFSTQLESKFLRNLWGDCFLVTILLHGVDAVQIIRARKENDSGFKKKITI